MEGVKGKISPCRFGQSPRFWGCGARPAKLKWVPFVELANPSTSCYDEVTKWNILERGGGRLGENRNESRQVKFRVSDLEFERLEQMAKAFQMSVPAFCKKKAQGVRMRPPKMDREGAFEVARQLRAIGNNVNQLSRRANEGNAIPKGELQDVQKELHALWQQLSSALQK